MFGLESIGCEVFFLEEIAPAASVDGEGRPVRFSASVNYEFFKSVVAEFDLSGRAALVFDGGQETLGAPLADIERVCGEADLLVNISGHLSLPRLFEKFRRRVFVDLDPGYTQFWQSEGIPGARLEGHHVHFTVGANIGRSVCPIPVCGLDWVPVRQPVVLDHWPPMDPLPRGSFTTVASWRGSFGPVKIQGREYGPKARGFRRYLEMPKLTGAPFEIVLDAHPSDQADLDSLASAGWRILRPQATVPDLVSFKRYVQGSMAEFSVAQEVYVGTRSGWFSDRTVRYLASGRPAIVEDTGFGDPLETGTGLLPFNTNEEAVEAVERVRRDYRLHSLAARKIAEEFFDARKVLPAFLDRAGGGR